MSTPRDLEEELKRLLLSATRSRPTDEKKKEEREAGRVGGKDAGKDAGKDGAETSAGKKIRKRRGKRKSKEGGGVGDGVDGAAGGVEPASSSDSGTKLSRRPSKESNRVTYPGGHPLRGKYS